MVPENQRNGIIIGYRLIFDQKTVDVNKESPTSAFIQDVNCSKAVPVRIYARTRIGASHTNSMLTIFPGKHF